MASKPWRRVRSVSEESDLVSEQLLLEVVFRHVWSSSCALVTLNRKMGIGLVFFFNLLCVCQAPARVSTMCVLSEGTRTVIASVIFYGQPCLITRGCQSARRHDPAREEAAYLAEAGGQAWRSRGRFSNPTPSPTSLHSWGGGGA